MPFRSRVYGYGPEQPPRMPFRTRMYGYAPHDSSAGLFTHFIMPFHSGVRVYVALDAIAFRQRAVILTPESRCAHNRFAEEAFTPYNTELSAGRGS